MIGGINWDQISQLDFNRMDITLAEQAAADNDRPFDLILPVDIKIFDSFSPTAQTADVMSKRWTYTLSAPEGVYPEITEVARDYICIPVRIPPNYTTSEMLNTAIRIASHAADIQGVVFIDLATLEQRTEQELNNITFNAGWEVNVTEAGCFLLRQNLSAQYMRDLLRMSCSARCFTAA